MVAFDDRKQAAVAHPPDPHGSHGRRRKQLPVRAPLGPAHALAGIDHPHLRAVLHAPYAYIFEGVLRILAVLHLPGEQPSVRAHEIQVLIFIPDHPYALLLFEIPNFDAFRCVDGESVAPRAQFVGAGTDLYALVPILVRPNARENDPDDRQRDHAHVRRDPERATAAPETKHQSQRPPNRRAQHPPERLLHRRLERPDFSSFIPLLLALGTSASGSLKGLHRGHILTVLSALSNETTRSRSGLKATLEITPRLPWGLSCVWSGSPPWSAIPGPPCPCRRR